jgi:hypothetical protein
VDGRIIPEYIQKIQRSSTPNWGDTTALIFWLRNYWLEWRPHPNDEDEEPPVIREPDE